MTHMDTIYSSCSNYCSSLDRECVGAWEEARDSCEILTMTLAATLVMRFVNVAVLSNLNKTAPSPDKFI